MKEEHEQSSQQADEVNEVNLVCGLACFVLEAVTKAAHEISEAMCLGNVDPEEILFVVRGNLAYLQRAINALSNTAEKVEAFCIEARKGD